MKRQSIVEMLFTFKGKPFYADVGFFFVCCKEATHASDCDME
jgi:hypothetical protein